jgi:hypothetical protein
MYVVCGRSLAQGIPRKEQYNIDTNMKERNLIIPTIEAQAPQGAYVRERPRL